MICVFFHSCTRCQLTMRCTVYERSKPHASPQDRHEHSALACPHLAFSLFIFSFCFFFFVSVFSPSLSMRKERLEGERYVRKEGEGANRRSEDPEFCQSLTPEWWLSFLCDSRRFTWIKPCMVVENLKSDAQMHNASLGQTDKRLQH